jgi:riboflavin synthase
MFTGIIETIGTVKSLQRGNKSLTISIIPDYDDYSVSRGGSVSVDGACLTVESVRGNVLSFTAVYETLEHTTLSQIKSGSRVNLERALRLGDRLEGHVVLGHVDGVGRIVTDRKSGDSVYRTIGIPVELRKFMAHKGSVAIDGISLTIAETADETITVALIPHTLSETTMSTKQPGQQVNIECDVFARYIHHQLSTDKGMDTQNRSSAKQDTSSNILSLLEDNEF